MNINKARRYDPLCRIDYLRSCGILQFTDCGNTSIRYTNVRALTRNSRTINYIATTNQQIKSHCYVLFYTIKY
jgi:hypothetical protein